MDFFKSGGFPSFKPLRTSSEQILLKIDTSIANAKGADIEYLMKLKDIAQATPNRVFYFTIAQAKLIGLV